MRSPEEADDNEPLFDARRVGHHLRFARGALRRRRRLVVSVFLTIVAATALVLWSLPRTYHVEAKVLAHANAALTVRSDGANNEVPTRTAADTILRRDALLALVEQHDLVRWSREHRAPSERARDALFGWLSSKQDTEQDRKDALVDLLQKRLSVWTNDNGSTITIAIDWPDPQMAVLIVDSAQQNYFESRYAQEVTALSESLGILQGHVESSRADVDSAVAALKDVRDERDRPRSEVAPARVGAASRVVSAGPKPVARAADPGDEAALAQLKTSLDAKQRTLADLEDFRNRRLADLQARLGEQQAIYTENHPAVLDLKQAIAALSGDSIQVKTLRKEIASLKAEYARRAAASAEPTADAHAVAAPPPPPRASSLQIPTEALRLELDLREDRDPNVMHARGQLRDAMDKYAALRTRIQTAEIDLETAKAAFKYRYTVVTPAHVPRKPVKPKTTLVSLLSIFAAFAVASVMAVVADVHAGRLVDRWQVERLLDRPIIAEIDLPRLPP